MKKLWDFKKVLSYLELKGQGRGTIMGVTRPLLLGPFYYVFSYVTPNISAASVCKKWGEWMMLARLARWSGSMKADFQKETFFSIFALKVRSYFNQCFSSQLYSQCGFWGRPRSKKNLKKTSFIGKQVPNWQLENVFLQRIQKINATIYYRGMFQWLL